MVCSKCGEERGNGKVVRGAFVCEPCIKLERKEKRKTVGALHKRWHASLCRDSSEVIVATATYRETDAYYVLENCDDSWPRAHDSRIKKGQFHWGRLPYHASLEEAVAMLLRDKASAVRKNRANLESSRNMLLKVSAYITENNISLPKLENEPEA